jgi:hypothetical protein
MATHPVTYGIDRRAARILARSFYGQLRAGGYSPEQVVCLASELIALVSDDIRQRGRKVGERFSAPC